MNYLEITDLEKSFGATRVVKDFTLSIEKGQFVSLLGPSGCGKTTVLRMVAGFETPSAGSITIDGQEVTGQRPNQRNIGMVFQAYALFPNLTVAQNVGFGLRIARAGRAEIEARVAEMLGLIGLPELGSRYPFQLSGGQQQRVALARALAPNPRVLLLDEPLSALDAKIRVALRGEIREIQKRLGITTIFVTHDQEEALSISDRVVVMNGGLAEQTGSPHEIYNRPATRFVANFVGTLSTLTARVIDPATGSIEIAGRPLRLPQPIAAQAGAEIAVALRPEALHLGDSQAEASLPATIRSVEFMGSVIRVRAAIAGTPVSLDMFNRPGTPPPTIGSKVELGLSPADVLVLGD